MCSGGYRAARQSSGPPRGDHCRKLRDAARPVLFSTLIILVAFIPLFTMQGVPGKIFAPMSVTYGFALTGALIFRVDLRSGTELTCSSKKQLVGPDGIDFGEEDKGTWLSRFFAHHYAIAFDRTFLMPKLVWGIAGTALIGAVLLFVFAIGGEFMPHAHKKAIFWIRATLPKDISLLNAAAVLADQLRTDISGFPEVTQVVSQIGRA